MQRARIPGVSVSDKKWLMQKLIKSVRISLGDHGIRYNNVRE